MVVAPHLSVQYEGKLKTFGSLIPMLYEVKSIKSSDT